MYIVVNVIIYIRGLFIVLEKKNGVNFYNSESKIWINFVIFYVFGIGIVYRIYIRYNSIKRFLDVLRIWKGF